MMCGTAGGPISPNALIDASYALILIRLSMLAFMLLLSKIACKAAAFSSGSVSRITWSNFCCTDTVPSTRSSKFTAALYEASPASGPIRLGPGFIHCWNAKTRPWSSQAVDNLYPPRAAGSQRDESPWEAARFKNKYIRDPAGEAGRSPLRPDGSASQLSGAFTISASDLASLGEISAGTRIVRPATRLPLEE